MRITDRAGGCEVMVVREGVEVELWSKVECNIHLVFYVSLFSIHNRAEKSTRMFHQQDFCAQKCSEVLRVKLTK